MPALKGPDDQLVLDHEDMAVLLSNRFFNANPLPVDVRICGRLPRAPIPPLCPLQEERLGRF